jgi:hypothetical protein
LVEIHHINGNREDNRIENLKAVTIEEHFDIHYLQNDYAACQAIMMRIKNVDKDIFGKITSSSQKKLLQEGRHNFQKMSKLRRKNISTKAGLYTFENGLGIHALNKNKEKHTQIASSGGKKARDLQKGFHNPEMNGYNFVRDTKWWTNTVTKEKVRKKHKPGPEWVRGMK